MNRMEHRAAALALVVGIALAGVKFVAYAITGSAAVFSDAIESIVNILASGLAMYAVGLAHRPPDEQHPYGHGKIEFISAGFEGGAICLAGAFIALRTVDQLWEGHLEVRKIDLGLLLVGLTVAANGAVGWMLIRLARRTSSAALEADGRHLISDSLTSLITIAALVVVKYTGWKVVDPLSALGIAALLVWMGWRLFRRAMGGLMDEQDSADHRRILAILDSHTCSGQPPNICSYHKVRHRHTGRYHWVDMHLQFPPDTTVREAHDAASVIEGEIEAALGEGDATAHVEPCQDCDCSRCAKPGPESARNGGATASPQAG